MDNEMQFHPPRSRSRARVAEVMLAAVLAAVVESAPADSVLESHDTTRSSDAIRASFDRDMNRDPTPATAITRAAIRNDVLYELVNEPLRSDDGNAHHRNR